MGKRRHKKGGASAPSNVAPIRPDVKPRKKNRKQDGQTISRREHIAWLKRNGLPFMVQNAEGQLPRNNLRLVGGRLSHG